MKSTITILFKFRFPFVRVPYPELICWVLCTDEGELWKPWRMKQSDYVYNMQSFMKTHSMPLSGLFDVDSFPEFSLLLVELFLSPFLSGPQMSSITSSWCWGFVLCYKGELGRQMQLLHQDHLLCQWQTTFIALPKRTEDHITGEQRIALCQIRVPVIFANFSDRFFFGAPLPLVTSCGS